jgi:hypothetical protein
MSHGVHLDWVSTKKMAEISGYTVGSLNKLKERGKVAYLVHWKHDPLKRIIWNVKAFEQWQQHGLQASNQDQEAA